MTTTLNPKVEIPTALNPKVENFPTALKERPAWVLWKYIVAGDEVKKVPFDPKSQRMASSTNPETWGSYEQVVAAYEAGGFAGYGVVLDGDRLVSVDLDDCVIDGAATQEALALMEQLDPAYVELSPSGSGIRMFGYGDALPAGVNGKYEGQKAEFYSDKRYMTITGHTLKNEPLREIKNFTTIARKFKVGTQTPSAPTANSGVPGDERYAMWVQQILTGEVYHDALRDLAASMVASGMNPAKTEATLYGFMDGVAATRDGRWRSRRQQIPELVRSAYDKFAVRGFADATASPGRYAPLGGADLRALPHTRWLVKSVLPETGLAAVFGPSGSGKTFLCMALAAALARGGEWFGHKVRPTGVMYVALEGEGGMKQRAAAWEHQSKTSLPEGLKIILGDFKITAAQDVADLAAIVQRGGVVFIDTLNRAAPEADENSSKDMGGILIGAKELQRKTGGLVVLVHHTGKDTTKGLRGHSSLHAALDAALEVERRSDDRLWRIAKSKDGDDDGVHPFILEQVTLGRDEDGDPITSCVVVPVVGRALPKPLTASQQRAVDALNDAIFQTATSVVPREEWRSVFLHRCDPEMKHEARRKAFHRAVDELVKLGIVAGQGDAFRLNDFTCHA